MKFRLAAALLATVSLAFAHYHFVHFPSRTGPFTPLYEKFDINALPDRTLTYFIAEPNGLQLNAGDSTPALLGQIRAAIDVWNAVDTSELRLSFGGVVPAGTPQAGPSLQISFEETPPGYVAYGGPVVKADPNGIFVPVVRSVVVVQPDLRKYASHSEALFSTLVHEIGHALGLQHSLASGVMSTATTRAVSRAKPLSTDDIAAISILYPRGNFSLVTGSISGRVTLNGTGVNLASVVAISANSAAVSTLTNPDGTYRIDGLPPRTYMVYVHPLPPPIAAQVRNADITYPVDNQGNEFPVGSPFETVFFPGVKEPWSAAPVLVNSAATAENIDFTVRARSGYSIHSVETFTAPANTWVKPPYLFPGSARPYLVAYGANLVQSSKPVTGLTATVLGGASLGVKPYAPAAESYVQMDVDQGTLLVPSDSPRHVILSTNNDIYVLPSAFFHVSRQAPAILSMTPGFDGTTRTLAIAGVNVGADTRIQFDGVQVPVRRVDDQGRLIVAPPPALPGHSAVVTALNTDGQSSLFLQADAPPTYVYPADAAPAAFTVALSPNALSPGMEAMITIDGLNTNFTEGLFQIGFGTTDITVRRIWVQSPTRALVNIAVSPTAQQGLQNVTIASGLNLLQQPFAFQVQPPQARPFWLSAFTMNPVSGQTSITPGNPATLAVGATPQPLSITTTAVLLNENRISLVSVQGNQVVFQVPANFPAGPAVARLEINGERSLPIIVNIDPLRVEGPRIQSVATMSTTTARTLRIGEIAMLTLVNAPRGAASKVTVLLGDREMKVQQVLEDADSYRVFIQVQEDAPTGDNVPVSVSIDSRISEPFSLTITR